MLTKQQKYLTNRRIKAKNYLGSKCVNCSSQEELEFDHIDPNIKSFEISKAIASHMAWQKLVTELDKCQLLCKDCHKIKSNKELSVEHGGGISGKRHCKCELCKAKWNEYMRNYRLNK